MYFASFIITFEYFVDVNKLQANLFSDKNKILKQANILADIQNIQIKIENY